MKLGWSKWLFALLLSSLGMACQQVPKSTGIPVLIDADTANEIDDLYALAWAVADDRLQLLGITAAQFHSSPLASDTSALESQALNQDLLRLMDRQDIPALPGSNEPLSAADQAADSPAARFIVQQAQQMPSGEKLPIIILGSCTNVASAILLDSNIVSKIRVLYLGFWHDPATNTYDKKEFNSGNDTLAVNLLLNTPNLEMSVMTATTSQQLVFEKAEVDRQFQHKTTIGPYLQKRWETYQRWWTEEDPNKERWIMWDIAIIAALSHPEWATLQSFPTPPENTQRPIGIYTQIQTDSIQSAFWTLLQAFP
ncbi:MAG: nucleoside hydrolase [Bacteroidota bacterium]